MTLRLPDEQLAELDTLIRSLPIADISSDRVTDRYAEIDSASVEAGRTLGKNDAWIAALTSVLSAKLVTADKDFDHLVPTFIERKYFDPTL